MNKVSLSAFKIIHYFFCCYFAGKKLFACQSAVRDFADILRTVGGEKEQQRARYRTQIKIMIIDNSGVTF